MNSGRLLKYDIGRRRLRHDYFISGATFGNDYFLPDFKIILLLASNPRFSVQSKNEEDSSLR